MRPSAELDRSPRQKWLARHGARTRVRAAQKGPWGSDQGFSGVLAVDREAGKVTSCRM